MTLRNVIISGGLFRSDGTPATVGDTIRLYKDDDTDFTAEITALADVDCGYAVNYTVEYESETVIRACELLDQGDVLDCCALLDDRVTVLEEEIELKSPLESPIFTGSSSFTNIIVGGQSTYGLVSTFLYIAGSELTHRTALGLGTASSPSFKSITTTTAYADDAAAASAGVAVGHIYRKTDGTAVWRQV